jgi:L-amino acid N-acyltransferase YncA
VTPPIRPATTADAAAIAAVYRPYVTDSVISFETEPPDGAEMARRMAAPPLLPWLVAERDNRVVGYAYASAHRARAAYRWGTDVSVYLDQTEQGRGTGRALYTRLFQTLRDLGYVAAYAGIALPNPASVGLHESMGFTLVGIYRQVGFKMSGWHDVGWWQLALVDPLPPTPAEPRPWTALTDGPDETGGRTTR